MSSVQNPSIIPFNPGWFIGIPRSWITIIPNMLGSIIPELIINQPGLWTLLISGGIGFGWRLFQIWRLFIFFFGSDTGGDTSLIWVSQLVSKMMIHVWENPGKSFQILLIDTKMNRDPIPNQSLACHSITWIGGRGFRWVMGGHPNHRIFEPAIGIPWGTTIYGNPHI